jgi:hypothetical protein
MINTAALLTVLYSLVLEHSTSFAFSPVGVSGRRFRLTREPVRIQLQQTQNNEEDTEEEDTEDDYNIAFTSTTKLSVPLPTRPPLTTMERERRAAEMELLAELYNGDDIIPGFQELWFSERGVQVQEQLILGDNCIGRGPDYWAESEQILTKLCHEDPSCLEPYVRLAKLYCLQARLDEAEVLSKHILLFKPYHFVALETIVATYAAKGQVQSARFWATRRLPTPPSRDRRNEWVERALEDAESILHQMITQESFFGPPDSHPSDIKLREDDDHVIADDEDAWQ